MVKEYIFGREFIDWLVILFVILIVPLILTAVIGVSLADYMGLERFEWWVVVVLFYLTISSLLIHRLNKILLKGVE